MNDVSVTWSVPDGCSVDQIPSAAPPIYSGDRMVLFGLLQSQPEERDAELQECCVTLRGTLECGDQKENIEHSIEFQIERKSDESNSVGPKLTIHRLAAKSFVQEKQDQLDDFEQDCKEKEAIVKISKASNVASKLTSFVAVDKESREPITAAMETRPIPLNLLCSGLGGALDYSLCSSPARNKRCFSFKGKKRKKMRAACMTLECAPAVAGADIDVNEEKKKENGGVKGFFRRLSFRKKKNKTKVSGKTAKKEEETEEEMEKAKATTSQRADEEQRNEEPAATSVTMTKESLMQIISLQKASGAWEMTEQLSQLCGSTETELKRACPDALPAAEDDGKVWATALALVLLAGKFGDKKDEWEMVGKKGNKWLKSQFANEADYEKIVSAAAKALHLPMHDKPEIN